MDTSNLSAQVEGLAGWAAAEDGKSISKTFSFADFASALAFVNKVGALAEAQNHHPDITLAWGSVGITLSTHSADSVTEKDIALAKSIDQL